jgi:hypothetical protein
VLKGELDDFALADIFRLISLARKTGVLEVERQAGRGRVFFDDGDVYYAESSLVREPLGQKLVRAGALTEGQLRRALDEHAATGRRLGQILVSSDWVSPGELEDAVRGQTEEAVFDLLRWEVGEFTWGPGERVETEVRVAVSVENLIMEASRRLDEMEIIARKIPSASTLLTMASKPPEGAVEINITPDEWRMLVLVNGSRSVGDIAAAVAIDEFEAMKTVYGLLSAGLVEVAPGDGGGEGEQGPALPTHPAPSEVELPSSALVEEPGGPEVASEEAQPEAAPPAVALEPAEHPFEPEPAAPEAAGDIEPEPGPLPGPDEEALEAPGSPPEPAAAEITREEAAEPDLEPPVPSDEAAEPELDAPVPSPEAAEPELDAPVPPEEAAEPELDEPATAEGAPEGPAADERGAAEGEGPPHEEPVSEAAAPSGPEDAPRREGSAAVRELAGLLGDPDRPRPARASEPERGQPDDRKRVEDDEDIDRGLIARLIDGVKGI